MHKIKISDSLTYRRNQPLGTREFSRRSADTQVTVRYWPWIPKVEIHTTRGRAFCVSGADCVAFIEALNETFRAMLPKPPQDSHGVAAEIPAAPANSEQSIMSRLLEVEIPHFRGRSACAR